jgi:tyrosyl-tRNA synthetase
MSQDNEANPSQAAPNLEIETALSLLERGCDSIFSREELRFKLQKSRTTGQPLRIKLGLDPTAPDIHLGFAVVLKKLRAFQDLGHQAHLIIGDFTAQIGDPTGKSKTRPQLTRAQVEVNAQTYQTQLFRILDKSRTVIHFNGDWLNKMSFADVIQLAAKYTVAQTLEREDFARRLEEKKPLGLHEILYPLCQGQDSVHILADVELGGTDQRFNNLVGRELQRANGQEAQVVMLLPLLVGTDGVQKMSKSLGNYIGIEESPGEMFGKAMSIPDAAMTQYFTLATKMPVGDINVLLAGHPMEAKKRLATEIVAQYHGAEAAQNARENFERQFSRRETPDEMPDISIGAQTSIVEILKIAFAVSGSEARRMISQGAVSLNEQKINDEKAPLQISDGAILRMGKRKWARLKTIVE